MVTRGTNINLRAYGGEIITRTIVRDMGDVVVVCKAEEYQAAQKQQREPIVVGFKKEYIVDDEAQVA